MSRTAKGTLVDCDEQLIEKVLDAALAVHRELGPGLLESVYEHAIALELDSVGVKACRQVEVPVLYKGYTLGTGFRADLIVEDQLLLELKAVDDFTSVHVAQVITYLRLLNFKRGYLINFNKRLLKEGIRRVSI